MTTLRRQILGLTAAVTLLVLLAFLVPLGLLLDRSAQQRAISDATHQAMALAPRLSSSPEDVAGYPGTTVFLPGGEVLGTPGRRTDAIELAALRGPITVRTRLGVDVLVPAYRPDGNAVIRVPVPAAELHLGVRGTMIRLALLGAALFAFALLIADRLARRLVSAATALAAVADRLSGGDLAARAADQGPEELLRIGGAINQLAVRIDELLHEQRQEAAALTHGLRTPLTALRLEADSLGDAEERGRLADAVHYMTRAVDEVIRTARRPLREGLHPAADLVDVVAQRLAFWSPLAEETGRTIDIRRPEHPVLVRLSAADAATLVDVLLDNVFTHTPPGTSVVVTVEARDEGGLLRVEDDGPGIAPGPLRSGPLRSDPLTSDPLTSDPLPPLASGTTGMGLQIAARVAADARGSLTIGRADPLGGARIEVHLAAATVG